MKFRINSCGISDCPPSWHWLTKKEGLPDYDLWAVFRGKGKICVAGEPDKTFSVYEGAAVLLTPNTQIEAEHEIASPLFVINIHFDFLDEGGNVIYPRSLTAKHIFDPSLMRAMLIRMVTLFNSGKKEEATAFLEAVMTEFDLSEILSGEHTEKMWVHMINEMCIEIEAGGDIPTLGEYAERYSYSERYLGKMFTKMCGISFSAYVKNVRIEKAQTLLCYTDIPITRIAEQTGFYDPGHFTKTFKSAVGVSPTEYRNDPSKR